MNKNLNSFIKELADKGDAVVAGLQKLCVLVTVRFHRWRGMEVVTSSTTSVCGVDVNSRVTKARWKLIPGEWNKKFAALEARARSAIDFYSVRSPIKGSRFVPVTKAEALFKECKDVRSELDDLADKFCTPEVFSDIAREVTDDLGAEAASYALMHLPCHKVARNKFGMDWFVVPIGSPDEVIKNSPSVYVAEAKAALNKVVLESVEVMLKEPRERLRAAVDNLVTLLNKGNRRLSIPSIDAIKYAFEEYKNWAFLSDDATLKALQTVGDEVYGIDVKMVNSDQDVANGLVASLKALTVQLDSDTAVTESFGKFKRAVCL